MSEMKPGPLICFNIIYLAVLDLICGVWDLVPGPVPHRPPALGALSLSHWSTRETPRMCLSCGLLSSPNSPAVLPFFLVLKCCVE